MARYNPDTKRGNVIYHYSTQKFDTIESLVNRGMVTNNSDAFQYGKNISFFMEPIPENIATLLHHKHAFWKKGTVVWEYVIDLNSLPDDINFYLAESPEKTELIYVKQDWDVAENDPHLIRQFKSEIAETELKLGYRGSGLSKLKRLCGKFSTGITEAYKKLYILSSENPEDNLLVKYAATVPHLMLYPKADETIEFTTARQVTFK